MQQVLIEEQPPVEIAILIVWIDMLAEDDREAANLSAHIFSGGQVEQFHDPDRHIGKAIAESLGATNAIAWDVYLFYDKEMEWKEHPPTPLDWAHQLDDPWADPDHQAWDKALSARLQKIIKQLISN